MRLVIVFFYMNNLPATTDVTKDFVNIVKLDTDVVQTQNFFLHELRFFYNIQMMSWDIF